MIAKQFGLARSEQALARLRGKRLKACAIAVKQRRKGKSEHRAMADTFEAQLCIYGARGGRRTQVGEGRGVVGNDLPQHQRRQPAVFLMDVPTGEVHRPLDAAPGVAIAGNGEDHTGIDVSRSHDEADD
ncbi:MAG: hypothetical protein ACYC0C_12475 [Devosia sp.]